MRPTPADRAAARERDHPAHGPRRGAAARGTRRADVLQRTSAHAAVGHQAEWRRARCAGRVGPGSLATASAGGCGLRAGLPLHRGRRDVDGPAHRGAGAPREEIGGGTAGRTCPAAMRRGNCGRPSPVCPMRPAASRHRARPKEPPPQAKVERCLHPLPRPYPRPPPRLPPPRRNGGAQPLACPLPHRPVARGAGLHRHRDAQPEQPALRSAARPRPGPGSATRGEQRPMDERCRTGSPRPTAPPPGLAARRRAGAQVSTTLRFTRDGVVRASCASVPGAQLTRGSKTESVTLSAGQAAAAILARRLGP